MDYPHGRPDHGWNRREDQEDDYPPPERSHPPPFYGQDEPPPPFYPPDHRHDPHHGRHRREEGGEYDYPPPERSDPPPFYGRNEFPPPDHTSHVGGSDFYHPPPPTADSEYPQPPSAEENRHRPHFPSFGHHSSYQNDDGLSEKPSVKIYSKAETNFSLTIRDGNVILAPSDPSDLAQHWIKDEKFSTKVKDEEGFPSFALINKATGQAMKHSIGATQPVQLTRYSGNELDESVLWTESRDLGDGYRTIRMVSNIRLNVDAFNGDENHGGVHDGTTIVLWEWKKGDNQRWNIAPYSD